MSDLNDLELIIQSQTPIIYIETPEEPRVVELSDRLRTRLGKKIYHWSIVGGLRLNNSKAQKTAGTTGKHVPEAALQQIMHMQSPGIFLFFDIHPWLDKPVIVRLLREMAQHYDRLGHTLILVSPRVDIPAELQALSVRFSLSLPGHDEIREMIFEESKKWGEQKQKRVQATQAVVDALVRNLAGLTFADARSVIRNLIYDDGVLNDDDLDDAITAKYKTLDSDGVLSFEMETARFSEVAGLGKMKQWLDYRKTVFLAEGTLPGLDTPKGLLLLGVQGGGKSLAAKSVAGSWQVPLLRLDFAVLYNKYYGETERNLREALKTAEVMAPCVLWIDEIEKGLSTDSDGGPSKRVLGTLLTWMAEKESKVFLVATANDIEALPPELLRKGRFDEIFFVDLPKVEVRREIFRIHLKKREQAPATFDLELLGAKAKGFSGAEIEQAVVASLYAAYARKQELTTEHLVEELEKTRPLSVLMAEKIAYLRSWAADRTVPAD